jgi:hypothetical protein
MGLHQDNQKVGGPFSKSRRARARLPSIDFLFGAVLCDRAMDLVHSLTSPAYVPGSRPESERGICQLVPPERRCLLGVGVDTALGSFLNLSDKWDWPWQ